jgi:outer membrane protein TolC
MLSRLPLAGVILLLASSPALADPPPEADPRVEVAALKAQLAQARALAEVLRRQREAAQDELAVVAAEAVARQAPQPPSASAPPAPPAKR